MAVVTKPANDVSYIPDEAQPPRTSYRTSDLPVDEQDSCSVYRDDDSLEMMATQTARTVPNLPAKSSLRVSRLLATLPHKIDSEEQTVLSQATPHEHDHYLSSEEDASSSADDLSDYSFDSDDELSPTSTEEAIEQVTARAISVVFAGKPALVELPRRSDSPASVDSRSNGYSTDSSSIRSSRSNPSFAKRISIMSFSAASFTVARPTSIYVEANQQARPNFLDSDPYPSMRDSPVPRMQAKTPGTMLKRTFNLVKRRSRPRLDHAANLSRDSLVQPAEQFETYHSYDAPRLQRSGTAPVFDTTASPPVTPPRMRVGTGLTGVHPRSMRT